MQQFFKLRENRPIESDIKNVCLLLAWGHSLLWQARWGQGWWWKSFIIPNTAWIFFFFFSSHILHIQITIVVCVWPLSCPGSWGFSFYLYFKRLSNRGIKHFFLPKLDWTLLLILLHVGGWQSLCQANFALKSSCDKRRLRNQDIFRLPTELFPTILPWIMDWTKKAIYLTREIEGRG